MPGDSAAHTAAALLDTLFEHPLRTAGFHDMFGMVFIMQGLVSAASVQLDQWARHCTRAFGRHEHP